MKHTVIRGAFLGIALGASISFSTQAAEKAMAPEIAMAPEMAKFKIVEETIPQSLTGQPGDPVNGKKVVIGRKKGNCLACHVMPIPEQQFHGLTGPDLHGVGDRMSAAELRMRLVDPKVISYDTMMPSFYRTGQHRVLKKFEGKTILSAQEIEDVIAYLMTLKDNS